MSKSLKVGDLCITVNTNLPACNDGVLVQIAAIDPGFKDHRGNAAPYLIRRLDGSPFVSTSDPKTGEMRWCKCTQTWSAAYKLKKVDGRAPALETALVSRRQPVPA